MNYTEAMNIPLMLSAAEHFRQPTACPLLEESHTAGCKKDNRLTEHINISHLPALGFSKTDVKHSRNA